MRVQLSLFALVALAGGACQRLSDPSGSVSPAVVERTKCPSSPESIPGGTCAVEKTVQAIHNKASCAERTLGAVGAGLAAASRYGNWCGPNSWGQNGLPVNCWDEACRKHDYSFHGPDPIANGRISCHEVLNVSSGNSVPLPGVVPDTACIDGADDVLCGEWTQCKLQADRARLPGNGGWHWVGAGNAMGSGRSRPIRRCDDPRAGDHGFPIRCGWYEPPGEVPEDEQVWLCDACPSASSTPPTSLPNAACAVSLYQSNQDQIAECCTDYGGDERAISCSCPSDRPLRREGAYSVVCLACPADRPQWNGRTGPCVEAYGGNAIPGSMVCCECATGTVECGSQCVSNSCSGGKVFDDAACSCACPAGTVECGGQCVDPETNPTNCACVPSGLSSDNWVGSWYSSGSNRGTWFPTVDAGGVGDFAVDDASWGILHSVRSFGLGDSLRISIRPVLDSGGAHPDGAFVGFTSGGPPYLGTFYGVLFWADGQVYVYSTDSATFSTMSPIGSFSRGAWVSFELKIDDDGSLRVTGDQFSGVYFPQTISGPVRAVVATKDSEIAHGFRLKPPEVCSP